MRPWPVWFGLAVLMLMAATALASPTSSHAITIVVNGETQHFDSPPVVIEGLVLVPLRGVFEKLGASVVWVGNGGTIRIEGGPVVHLKLGSREASVGDRLVKLEAEPRYYGHRIYVPLRFVTEALGARVSWSPGLRKIEITSAVPSIEGFLREPEAASGGKVTPSAPATVPPSADQPRKDKPDEDGPKGDTSTDDDVHEWRA